VATVKHPLTYRRAGVHVSRADRFIKDLSRLAKKTHRKELISGIGHFSALFRTGSNKGPVFAASSDGVGTKVLLATNSREREVIGQDLVAMNVNDCLAVGAEPLVFLDYYATSVLRPKAALEVMRGIVKGCREAGCMLLGGETAEMPGLYRPGHFDLAGFCLGLVKPGARLWGPPREGDLLIGLTSNGVHSNGFSLIRAIFRGRSMSPALRKLLMRPTAIYVKPVLKLLSRFRIRAIVHITGGGWQGNIPRVLPKGLGAEINLDSWKVPQLFKEIKKRSQLSQNEMFSTFNMGVGLVLCVPKSKVPEVQRCLKRDRIRSWVVGKVIKGKGKKPGVVFKGQEQ
jgi:phosphoribosylformylglycinamidine cyclo-ligase